MHLWLFSQPEHLLNTSDVTVQCQAPSVIIRTVATEEISSSVTETELTVDPDVQPVGLLDPPTSLETDAFPDELHQPKLSGEEHSAYSRENSSKFVDSNSTELMDRVMVRTRDEILDTDHKQEGKDCQSDLAGAYVSEVSQTRAVTASIRSA